MLKTLTLLIGFASTSAMAQDYEYGDETPKSEERSQVREIVKGTFAKTNVGSGIYLGRYSGYVSPGTSIALAVGQDFMDQETISMAWEVSFFQGINNGTHYEDQGAAAPSCRDTGNCIQGDLRTYTFVGLVEGSWYPTRRIGIGLRAGGGILFAPLLMDEKYYQQEVVENAWSGFDPGVHSQPHPTVMGGPTLEYYTKLSHFSVGLDADIFYAVQFDIGASLTATLKYTF